MTDSSAETVNVADNHMNYSHRKYKDASSLLWSLGSTFNLVVVQDGWCHARRPVRTFPPIVPDPPLETYNVSRF